MLRHLRMMAGQGNTPAERRVARQIKKFRREVAQRDQAMLLIDKIKEREAGTEGFKPMPFARKP